MIHIPSTIRGLIGRRHDRDHEIDVKHLTGGYQTRRPRPALAVQRPAVFNGLLIRIPLLTKRADIKLRSH